MNILSRLLSVAADAARAYSIITETDAETILRLRAERDGLTERLTAMHRRAQKAEGEIARWPRIRVSHEREMDRWRERHYSRVRWMAEQINGARAQRNEAQREAEKLRDGIAYDTAKILDLEAQRNELRDEMLAYEGERDEARKRLTRVASLAAPWTTDNPPGAMDVLRSIVDICEGK